MNSAALSNRNKEMLKDAGRGALFGIGIGFAFRLALVGMPTNLLDWLATSVFGMVIGFALTLSIEFMTKLILLFMPSLGRCLSFHFLLDFMVGFGVFYSIAYFSEPFGFERENIFHYSVAVAISAAMIGLFFLFMGETEEKIRLEEENKRLAVLEERNRVARELHDSVAQALFGINLHLSTIDYLNKHQPQDLPKVIAQLQEMVVEIQAEMRLMIYELKPTIFVEKGFSESKAYSSLNHSGESRNNQGGNREIDH